MLKTHRGRGAGARAASRVPDPRRRARERCVVRANEPRRGTRQGNLNEAFRRPTPRSRGERAGTGRLSNVKMTLGNGYLGSRIDEERSEMRYLV